MTNEHKQKLRFGLVGGVNTALDFGLLFILKSLGLDTIPANILSSGAAFMFSFFANRSYTFKASKTADLRRQIIMFCLVTLTGIWILQSIILAILTPLFESIMSHTLALLAAKFIATIFSLIWNYTLYAKLVFPPEAKK